jgi:hypothetical protein
VLLTTVGYYPMIDHRLRIFACRPVTAAGSSSALVAECAHARACPSVRLQFPPHSSRSDRRARHNHGTYGRLLSGAFVSVGHTDRKRDERSGRVRLTTPPGLRRVRVQRIDSRRRRVKSPSKSDRPQRSTSCSRIRARARTGRRDRYRRPAPQGNPNSLATISAATLEQVLVVSAAALSAQSPGDCSRELRSARAGGVIKLRGQQHLAGC